MVWPVAQKAPEVKLFIIYIIANKNNPKIEVSNLITFLECKASPRKQDSYIKMTRSEPA